MEYVEHVALKVTEYLEKRGFTIYRDTEAGDYEALYNDRMALTVDVIPLEFAGKVRLIITKNSDKDYVPPLHRVTDVECFCEAIRWLDEELPRLLP